MPRRREVTKREILPDPKYNNRLVARFINSLLKPVIEVKSRRVGGSTYQVPTEVIPSRRVALGIRWLITHARERSEKTMREKLAAELIDAANNRGGAIKKREAVHKMAEANKAFAHYRF